MWMERELVFFLISSSFQVSSRKCIDENEFHCVNKTNNIVTVQHGGKVLNNSEFPLFFTGDNLHGRIVLWIKLWAMSVALDNS